MYMYLENLHILQSICMHAGIQYMHGETLHLSHGRPVRKIWGREEEKNLRVPLSCKIQSGTGKITKNPPRLFYAKTFKT